MKISLPHFLFENKELYQIINDESIIVAKSTRYKQDMVSLRNSMHLAILLINGGKVLHLENGDISIDNSDLLFLSQGNYFMSEILGDKNSFESILLFFDDEYIFNFIQKYQIVLESKEQKEILLLKRDTFMVDCIKTINCYFQSQVNNTLALAKLKVDELFYMLCQKIEKNSAHF